MRFDVFVDWRSGPFPPNIRLVEFRDSVFDDHIWVDLAAC